MSKDKKLRIGIVGVGTIGRVHAEALAACEGAELAAMCDIDEARLAERCAKFGVKASTNDYRELVRMDLDAVYVCVPNYLHRDVAVAAFKAGKHVFLEKPMAMSTAQAQEIVAAGKKAKKTLQVGMVWRQRAEARMVREYVEKGTLGEIYQIRAVLIRRRGIPGMGGWFTTKSKSGGGPLIDLGVHWLDVSMWMSGLWNPTACSAKTYSKFGHKMKGYHFVDMWAGPPNYKGVFDVEDYAAGFVRFGNKATLSFEVSWAANAQEDVYVEILGDKGGVRVFDNRPMQILTEHDGRPADIAPKFATNPNGFLSEEQAFVAACRGDAPPAATGEEGVTVMKVLDAIYASSAANREVRV